MKHVGILLSILGLAAIGAAFGASRADAFGGNRVGLGPNYSPERHAQMVEIINNNDYSAWKALMGDRPVTEKITADNFARFAEMKRLMWEGKIAQANLIRQELSLGLGRGQGGRHGGGFIDRNGDGVCDHQSR